MSNENESDDVIIEDEDHSNEYFSTSNEDKRLINKNIFVDYRFIGLNFLLLILIVGFWIRRKNIWKKVNKRIDSSSTFSSENLSKNKNLILNFFSKDFNSIDRYEQMNKIRLEQQKRYDQQIHQREVLLDQKKKLIEEDHLSTKHRNDSTDSNSNGKRRLRTTNEFDDKSSCSYRPQSRRSNGKRG